MTPDDSLLEEVAFKGALVPGDGHLDLDLPFFRCLADISLPEGEGVDLDDEGGGCDGGGVV